MDNPNVMNKIIDKINSKTLPDDTWFNKENSAD